MIDKIESDYDTTLIDELVEIRKKHLIDEAIRKLI